MPCRPSHSRTPGYIFGCYGIIERHCGQFGDPSLLAYGIREGPMQHMYRVRFMQQVRAARGCSGCHMARGAWGVGRGACAHSPTLGTHGPRELR